MKKIVFLSNMCFFTISGITQDYFNKRIEFGEPGIWDGITNCFVLPDGYIFGGTTGTPGNVPWHRLGFYKTDFQGNKLFSKTYGDSLSEYFIGNPGSIVRYNDTLIVADGSMNTYTSNWVHQEGLLYFLNNDFDTLFVKHFGEKVLPIDTAYLFRQVKKTNTNEIIIAGGKKPYGLASKIVLIKTDGLGNEHYFTGKAIWL